MDSTATALIIATLLFALIIRLVAGSMDRERVRCYIAEQGAELKEQSWDPFGPGWFGGSGSRIYRISYCDKEGKLHRAYVKTSAMSGVYLSGDSIVKSAGDKEATGESLETENTRLKARIRELEGN